MWDATSVDTFTIGDKLVKHAGTQNKNKVFEVCRDSLHIPLHTSVSGYFCMDCLILINKETWPFS